MKWPYAYVAYQGGAADPLRVIDVSSPSSPSLRGLALLPDWPWGIVHSGDYCYVTCLDSGLRIYDVSDPGLPEQVGYHLVPGWALGPAVENSYIYLASDYTGLGIYENELITGVAGPAEPAPGTEPIPGPTVMRAVQLARFTGRVLDVQGREVRDRGRLRPGVYFLRPPAGTGEGDDTRKVILAR